MQDQINREPKQKFFRRNLDNKRTENGQVHIKPERDHMRLAHQLRAALDENRKLVAEVRSLKRANKRLAKRLREAGV